MTFWFYIKENNLFGNKDIKYQLTNEHSLDITEHNYYSNRDIKEDLENKPLIYIKRKINNDLIYLYQLIKEEAIRNNLKDTTGKALNDFIKEKYCILNIDYKNKFLSKYSIRERHKKSGNF